MATVAKKDVHDASYYIKCMIGGALACGLTHAAICPLDIVKCRMQVPTFSLSFSNSISQQVNPGLYKGLGHAFSSIKAAEGTAGFTLVTTFEFITC